MGVSSSEHVLNSGSGVNVIKTQFTLEIKHCFMTKLQISQGPSEHQQKRTSGRASGSSRIPWVTRNSVMSSMTSGKDGALSVWSCGERVRHATAVIVRDQHLGYARQAHAELGEFWSPCGLHESLKLGNDI